MRLCATVCDCRVLDAYFGFESDSIAYARIQPDGKMCVVRVRASPFPSQHLALLDFGSTVSCSAKRTIAAAIFPNLSVLPHSVTFYVQTAGCRIGCITIHSLRNHLRHSERFLGGKRYCFEVQAGKSRTGRLSGARNGTLW